MCHPCGLPPGSPTHAGRPPGQLPACPLHTARQVAAACAHVHMHMYTPDAAPSPAPSWTRGHTQAGLPWQGERIPALPCNCPCRNFLAQSVGGWEPCCCVTPLKWQCAPKPHEDMPSWPSTAIHKPMMRAIRTGPILAMHAKPCRRSVYQAGRPPQLPPSWHRPRPAPAPPSSKHRRQQGSGWGPPQGGAGAG